ncbi:Heat shock factor protein [Phytophthora citrophthora]|uniref:Heat shock factor protein n=1 Tax=Phytophthora citrophthora TaxID=4793 RepID=A0AAD9LKU1_9STRA|nr:Heat shock factor protein [Phytophthora citrophthora]
MSPTKQSLPQVQDPADGTTVKEVAPFLRSLRQMLDTESPRILCWTPDGRAFEIHDMAAMTGYVLPKYFKHRKYASFQRQLNYFHFRKWTKSRAVVCTFSNQFFQRDQPALTWRITRKRPLSPSKHSNSKSVAKKEIHASPTPDEQLAKQLDPVVSVKTALSSQQPEVFDEDASLAWIDVLYPELDLDLLDSDPTGTDCFFSAPKLLVL